MRDIDAHVYFNKRTNTNEQANEQANEQTNKQLLAHQLRGFSRRFTRTSLAVTVTTGLFLGVAGSCTEGACSKLTRHVCVVSSN